MRQFVNVLLLSLLAVSAHSNSCTNPKVSVTSFSTQDATILKQLAHIGEFTLECSNEAKPNLFAEFPYGKVMPVAKVSEGKYQVSWTEEIKKGSSGNILVRLFDEDGYANLRKVQRDGGKVSDVKSLVDITINTKGAYKGPWVQAEIVAAMLVGIIAYFAITTKSRIQA